MGGTDPERSGPAHQTSVTETTPLLNPPPHITASPNEGASGSSGNEERTIIASNISTARLCLILCTAWVGIFLSALDSTIIATLSGPISSEFDSLSLLSWLATSYIISNAAVQPISGRLTDIFGRGPGLVFCNVVFAAGNLTCGLAKSQTSMILGRLVAGLGGGGLITIASFLGSDLIPLRKRGLVGGISNIFYSCGAMSGSIVGGILNDYTDLGWRTAFLAQVPPALISAVAVMMLVKLPPKQSSKSYLSRIDFGGAILVSLFLTSLVLGLNSGGNLVPWTHPLPIASTALSVLFLFMLIWWESKASQPIIPVKLLLDRTVFSCCLSLLIIAAIAITSTLYIPLYLQVLGNSASESGLKLFPAFAGMTLGALGSGFYMRRTGKYVGLNVLSGLAIAVAAMMFTFQDEASPAWITVAGFFLLQAGYGAILSVTQTATLASVDYSLQAVATATTFLARNIGSTIGITMISVAYQNTLSNRLWHKFGDEPGAKKEISRILGNLDHLQNLPGGWYEGVIKSFMEAFHVVWLLIFALSLLALICISPMKQHMLHSRLDRK